MAEGGHIRRLERQFNEDCGLVDGKDLNEKFDALRDAIRIGESEDIGVRFSESTGTRLFIKNRRRLRFRPPCRFQLDTGFSDDGDKFYRVLSGTFYAPFVEECETEDIFREGTAMCLADFPPDPPPPAVPTWIDVGSPGQTSAHLVWACFEWEFNDECEQWSILKDEDTDKQKITTFLQDIDPQDLESYDPCNEPKDEFDEDAGTGKSYRLIGGIEFITESVGGGPIIAGFEFALKKVSDDNGDCVYAVQYEQQNLCSDLTIPCPCICDNSSSSSSGSSSSSSSAGSSQESSDSSDFSDSGSSKDTAVVPFSRSAGGYTSVAAEESPYVIFNDYMRGVDLHEDQRITRIPVDKGFMEICEPGTFMVFASGDWGGIGARFDEDSGDIVINNAKDEDERSKVAAIQISAIRKDFKDYRFPDLNVRDFWNNELRLGHPEAAAKLKEIDGK